MRTENWNGHKIRFIEKNGEWWAILKDVEEVLNMVGHWTSSIDTSNIDEILIDGTLYEVINECAIYDFISRSNTPKSRKFRQWSYEIMRKLRKSVGLNGFEVFRMLDDDIQKDIDSIIDTLYYDQETGKLMRSVTVAGGDVDQVPFEV